jgi:hypothetical protein
MTDRFDVAARLAEGRPAVEHTQAYVQACHELGYQQPDLTARASQVWQWYDTEAGLDLRVLDDDSAELCAAVNAIDEALWVQRTQLTELATAWRGPGAEAAMQFLRRHTDTAAEVAAQVRAAAEGCATLRDNVWQSVDGKVAGTTAIDERRLAQRSAWLSAAHTVTTGVGDRSAAEDLVRQQVIPYVDNDIRIDWLAVMRSTTASVAASYDAAIRALTSTPEACFEVPAELGPSWQPVAEDSSQPIPAAPAPQMPAPVDPVPTLPAAAPAPLPPTTQAPQPPSSDGLDALSSLPSGMASPLGGMDGLSTGTGGLSSIGGIGGVLGQIVDSIGGLLGSLTDGLGDDSGSDDSLVDDPFDADDPPAEDAAAADADADADADEPGHPDDEVGPATVAEDADAAKPAAQVTESPPAAADVVEEPAASPPIDPPPPAAPADQAPSVAGPQPDGSTPCEIAEDELPQAGQ